MSKPSKIKNKGNSSVPFAVPPHATIHIDFQSNQAWSANSGVVAVSSLVGSDPNTVNGWSATSYNPSNLTPNGYVAAQPFALIGEALQKYLGGSIARVQWVKVAGVAPYPVLAALSSDGSFAAQAMLGGPSGEISVATFGTENHTVGGVANTTGTNVLIARLSHNEIAAGANGNPLSAVQIDLGADVVGDPFALDAVLLDASNEVAVQTITLFDLYSLA